MGVPYSAIEQVRKCIGLEECEDLHPRRFFKIYIYTLVTLFIRGRLILIPPRWLHRGGDGGCAPQYQHCSRAFVSIVVPFVAHL